MGRIALHWQILIALIAGATAGFLLGDTVLHIEFLGTLFLKALKMVIVPLIATSIISGVAGIGDQGNLGRLGGKTLVYYLSTSLLAVLTGLLLVNLLQPGAGAELGLQQEPEQLASSMAQFGDSPAAAVKRLFLNMVPANPIRAMVEGEILQDIVFCLLLGACITRLASPHREALTRLAQGGFDAMMGVTHLVIAFAPVGIFALVAKTVAITGFGAFVDLAVYAACVLVGLAFHAAVSLPLILLLVARVHPLRHLQAMAPALLTAFSTSSSSATLPVTLECLEKRAGVSNRIASFVVPLGATVNMDGTALYECVAAMFIAQAYGIDLSFSQQFLVVITALLASVGAAGIPMAGLVMISVILTAVGLPLEGLGLILAVDRVLDMCRTTVNVWSDSCGAAVIGRTEGERLQPRT
jgi:proton glutamate symport protein